jgi:hypothetical protein
MEKQVKIQTGRSLSQAIETIMKESLKQALYQNGLEEKEKQSKMLGEEDDDLFADSGDESKSDDKPASSKTVDDEKEKLKKGDVDTKDIVDKLNTIRSGKSFKDETIAAHLDEYVKSLSKAEKVALLAFLKGLAQIVTGEIPADDATNPADPGPDVEMKKGGKEEKKTKSIKPNVIKAPTKEKSEKKPSSEDTSGPVPITPKKK